MLPGQRTSAGPFDWDHSGKACKGGAVEWKVKGHCFAALRHYLSPRYQAMLIQKAAGVRDRLLMGSSWKGPIAAWRSCSWDKSWGAILMNCSSQGRLLLGESIGQLLLVNMTASCMLYVLFCSWLSCFRHFARRFWIVESKNEREFVYDTRIIPGTIPKMREKERKLLIYHVYSFQTKGNRVRGRVSERENLFMTLELYLITWSIKEHYLRNVLNSMHVACAGNERVFSVIIDVKWTVMKQSLPVSAPSRTSTDTRSTRGPNWISWRGEALWHIAGLAYFHLVD